MSSRIKNNLKILEFLSCCKRAQRKALISTLNKEEIFSICECIDNFLSGYISTNDSVRRKLARSKRILRRLRNKSINYKTKKKLLVQHGGFLPSLLVPVLGVVGSVISGLLNK